MTEKIVGSIKESERSAKGIIETAKKENQAELEESKANAKEKLKSVNAAKQRSIADAKSRAAGDAEKAIDALKEEYSAKISRLNDIAAGNLEESVKFIISKI